MMFEYHTKTSWVKISNYQVNRFFASYFSFISDPTIIDATAAHKSDLYVDEELLFQGNQKKEVKFIGVSVTDRWSHHY